MKKLFVVLGLLVGSTAMAMPAVGDSADYNFTLDQEGFVLTGTLQMKLTAYDSMKKTYTRETTTTIAGQTSTSTDDTPEADLLTDAQVDAEIANCVSLGGTLEPVTVPAGTFDTCALGDTAGNKQWTAKVPFGIAKGELMQEGAKISLELTAFTSGK